MKYCTAFKIAHSIISIVNLLIFQSLKIISLRNYLLAQELKRW